MDATVLSMGDNKRYIGVRLYLPTSETTNENGGQACVDVKPAEMGVGSNSIAIKARREHYKDSRLAVLRGGGGHYLLILSKLAGLSVVAAIIAAIGGGWHGYVVSGIIIVVGSAFVLKDSAWEWLKQYFQG